MKKRAFVAILAMTMLMGSLAGCNSGGGSSTSSSGSSTPASSEGSSSAEGGETAEAGDPNAEAIEKPHRDPDSRCQLVQLYRFSWWSRPN